MIIVEHTCAGVMIVGACFYFFKELEEMISYKQGYFSSLWNFYQFSLGTLNITILEVKYLKFFTLNDEIMTYLAIASVALIWLNVYYWSRLFAKF